MTTMKKIIFTILTVLFLIGCRTSPKTKITYWQNENKAPKETFYENGNIKTRINYKADGTKFTENTYYKNGKNKTSTLYQEGGKKVQARQCFGKKYNLIETCTLEKHGCTSTSNTCIN